MVCTSFGFTPSEIRGQWTSKLGDLQDILHDKPNVVGGGAYGSVAVYMKRERE